MVRLWNQQAEEQPFDGADSGPFETVSPAAPLIHTCSRTDVHVFTSILSSSSSNFSPFPDRPLPPARSLQALWLSQVLSAWLLVATALHWARARELYAGQAQEMLYCSRRIG